MRSRAPPRRPARTRPRTASPPSGAAGAGTVAPGTGPAAGRVSWAAGQGSSADHSIGVGYEISRGPGGIVQGRIVILDRGRAPVTGWRLRLVLPGDQHYHVINGRNRSAGDSLVVQPGSGQGTLSPGRFELVAFTAQGASSAPVSCLVEDAAGLADGPGPGSRRGAPGRDREERGRCARAAAGRPRSLARQRLGRGRERLGRGRERLGRGRERLGRGRNGWGRWPGSGPGDPRTGPGGGWPGRW